jgi:hypothetical protein
MSSALLNEVLPRLTHTAAKGRLPLVVFDLDSTLFCTGARNLAILNEFVSSLSTPPRGLRELVSTLGPADMGWNVNDALRKRGVDDTALHAELKRFWSERFFTDAMVLHDEPLPGAAAFARACQAHGAMLYYLTGRHVGGMEHGTAASLLRHGFPLLDGRSVLHLKPSFTLADRRFKEEALAAIHALRGEVVATFENEPGNANLFLKHFPDAQHFLLETVHSPDAEAPDARLVRLSDFRHA